MNKKLLNRLDFKNGQLEKWLNECPFPITNFRQMDFETEGQKQVEILVDIPIEQTTVNLDHYGLTLDQKTADLEMQFIKIDKQRKALISESVKLRREDANPLKQKKIEDQLMEVSKRWHKIGKELTNLAKESEKQ
jgi:hypothetical protein|tara:strand:- start:250 stop:654 length:405 start_codon:yes stop_codon:yes gene_type:complete